MDRRLRSLQQFASSCVTRDGEQFCCRSWSLPNLIARFSNKTDCSGLTTDDVYAVREALDLCSDDYRRKSLHRNCFEDPKSCPHVPSRCYAQENLIFDLLHYVLDGEFVDRERLSTGKLTRNNIFLPVAKSSNLLPFFHELDSVLSSSSDLLVHITSFDVGLKDTLFERLLVEDTKLLAVAFLTVSAIVWIYTQSFCIMILTSFNLVASLGRRLCSLQVLVWHPLLPVHEPHDRRPSSSPSARTPLSSLSKSGTGRRGSKASVRCKTTSARSTNGHSCPLCCPMGPRVWPSSPPSSQTSLPSNVSVFSPRRQFLSSTSRPSLQFLPCSSPISSSTTSSGDSGRFAGLFSLCKGVCSAAFRVVKFLRYFLSFAVVAVVVVSTVLLTQNFHLPDSDHFSIFYSDHPFETFDTKYRDLFKFSHRISEEESSIWISDYNCVRRQSQRQRQLLRSVQSGIIAAGSGL